VAPESPPTLYVIAGPNGSGKSTLAAQLRAEFATPPGIWINADDIAARMRAESSDNTDKSLAAAIEADRLRHVTLDAGHDLITETVMSDARWVIFFQRAKARGYRIALYFVTTSDPAINVARVRARVALGGHAVPEERIRARYEKVMGSVLPRVLPLTDKAYLFDNSGVESGMRLIAVYRDKRLIKRDEALASALADWLAGLMG
jgi:predicted ABC-type ATPase